LNQFSGFIEGNSSFVNLGFILCLNYLWILLSNDRSSVSLCVIF
jgi:hypothetical protein